MVLLCFLVLKTSFDSIGHGWGQRPIINMYCRVTNEREIGSGYRNMSTRYNKHTEPRNEISKLRNGLEELKAQARTADATDVAAYNVHSHEFDQLTPTEQSAASLGVSPTAWKPISFLNNGHYTQMLNANMLDDELARRIEAFKTVATNSS